jgi:hypothetical protein
MDVVFFQINKDHGGRRLFLKMVGGGGQNVHLLCQSSGLELKGGREFF